MNIFKKIINLIKITFWLFLVEHDHVELSLKMFTLSEDCIRQFKDEINWGYISVYYKLSENFIREFKDRVHWSSISSHQTLSESFIEEFKDRVHWFFISDYQKLSENFIRKFENYVSWSNISSSQKLSENFITEFEDKLYIPHILRNQTSISEDFLNTMYEKYKDNFYYSISDIKMVINEPSREEKIEEITEYANKFNLKFDGEYLYAYRNHDIFGRGLFNKTIFYEKGKYYKDFHCNMKKDEENSFGLGIWPKGNTKVKVSVDDFGVVSNRYYGKCRVKGLTVLGKSYFNWRGCINAIKNKIQSSK